MPEPVAARCGVVSTSAVSTRTTLLVARFRYHLQIAGADAETILCEEIVPLACTGPADAPQWLSPEEGERLLAARPERNLDRRPPSTSSSACCCRRCRSSSRRSTRSPTSAPPRSSRPTSACARPSRTKGRVTIRAGAPGGHPRGLCPVAEVELSHGPPQPATSRPSAPKAACCRPTCCGACSIPRKSSTARGPRTTACRRASA